MEAVTRGIADYDLGMALMTDGQRSERGSRAADVRGTVIVSRTGNGSQPSSDGLQRDPGWAGRPERMSDHVGRQHVRRICDVAAFGIRGKAAENLSAGIGSVEGVIAQWQGSSGHNTNMLMPDFCRIGIARAGPARIGRWCSRADAGTPVGRIAPAGGGVFHSEVKNPA